MNSPSEIRIFNKTTVLVILAIASFPPTLFFIQDYYIDPGSCSPEVLFATLHYSFIFSIVATFTLFYGNVGIVKYFHLNFPWEKSPFQRLIRELPLIVIFTSLAMFGLSYGFLAVNPRADEFVVKQFVFKNVLIANAITLMVVLVFEGYFFFLQWQQIALKAERLEKEGLKAEYSSLKANINPHFLFNSLNSLLTLVREDAEKSEKFVIHLSKVYRYVLDNQEKHTTTLEAEMKFAESYLYLHQIRFGENLQLQKTVGLHDLQSRIPPLTLQLLLENAIKHNIISSERPLRMAIKAEGKNQLKVTNNFQPRTDQVDSTGLGQENLMQRYKLLGGSLPTFGVNGGFYQALVPLLTEAEA